MPKYQNTALKSGNSEFVEIGTFSGATASFSAKVSRLQVSTQSVDVTAGKLVYVLPKAVFASTDVEQNNRLGVVNTVFRIEFNAVDLTDLRAVRTEALRLFDAAERALVHGVVPGASETFEAP